MHKALVDRAIPRSALEIHAFALRLELAIIEIVIELGGLFNRMKVLARAAADDGGTKNQQRKRE